MTKLILLYSPYFRLFDIRTWKIGWHLVHHKTVDQDKQGLTYYAI